jgi:hypothetical protein
MYSALAIEKNSLPSHELRQIKRWSRPQKDEKQYLQLKINSSVVANIRSVLGRVCEDKKPWSKIGIIITFTIPPINRNLKSTSCQIVEIVDCTKHVIILLIF